ncbi:MAG: glycosyltransferase [Nitrospirota bacterium]|nr:glycosyltransferase [Nitrospirota bacterium]
MRIGIQTWGSEGDIRPFIALACGLAQVGHQVTLAVTGMEHPEHEEVCARMGVTLRRAGHLTPEMERDIDRRVRRYFHRFALPTHQLAEILDCAFRPFLSEMDAAARDLCAQSDVVIGHFCCFSLHAHAERGGVPLAVVILAPGMTPTGFEPPAPLPNMGRGINRWLWRVADRMTSHIMGPYSNPRRRELGLAPITRPLVQASHFPYLTLIGVDAVFCPPRPDWPEQTVVTGFLALPEEAIPWHPDPPLARFLAAGPPPVLFTFGSMTPRDPEAWQTTVSLMTRAAQLAGCRALIHVGAEVPEGLMLPDGMRAVGRMPFDRLMAHCAAVVHHGGSGTTQTATAAGKPQVVVEHIADQLAWGMVLKRLGIAPAPLHRRNVTPKKLARAVRRVLDHPHMAQAARAAARRMHPGMDNGVARAVTLIEQALRPNAADR